MTASEHGSGSARTAVHAATEAGQVDTVRAPAVDAASSAAPEERDALPPQVDLERLLRLPDTYRSDSPRRGGATRSEWRIRFVEVHDGVAKARGNLAAAREKLGNLAGDGGQWQVAAPGIGTPDPENTTLSYKLRQDLRRLRDELDDAETRLLDLQVQADLADVPADWRE